MTTVREAERAARQLLDATWWTTATRDEPLPVDPMKLAERLGILVVVEPMRPDQSGYVVIPSDGTVVIHLNLLDSPNRQRFTCAHELGHYLRRRDDESHARRAFPDYTFVDYRDTLAGAGVDPEEVYANQFAAALLMPGHLVQRWQQQYNVEAMAQRFGTSTQAMKLRLRNLRLA